MDAAIQELQLAGFLMGENLFAIDIMRIKEIVSRRNLPVFHCRTVP
jgi:purine-binding chemotaxis protein CheW